MREGRKKKYGSVGNLGTMCAMDAMQHTRFLLISSCFLSASVFAGCTGVDVPVEWDPSSPSAPPDTDLARSSATASSLLFSSTFSPVPVVAPVPAEELFLLFFFFTRPSLTLEPLSLSFPPPPVEYSSMMT